MSNTRILISVDELEPLIAQNRIAVVDTRFDLADPAAGRRSYEEGHIPGARLADQQTVG